MRFCIRDDSRKQILRSEDGLTVECKPVDARHGPGTDYCDRGIQRFVDGDYAWAMQEAIMIGYIRDGRTICGNLLPVMKKEASIRKLKTLSLPILVTSDDLCHGRSAALEQLHQSTHAREFAWRNGKGAATPITVYHSWHQAY